MTEKRGGGGSELGLDLDLDPDQWKILQNYMDFLGCNNCNMHCNCLIV